MEHNDSSSSSSCDFWDDRDGGGPEPPTRGGAESRSPSAATWANHRPRDGRPKAAAPSSATLPLTPPPPRRHPLLGRSVVHLDVDCFYCQCEELSDPTGTLSSRPLAIGQKHIVVTCNYAARERGVRKLMLRTDALRVCPGLVIREGSDLEPYRRQARRIYVAFRDAVKSLPGGEGNASARGGMDEMYAYVTAAVDAAEEGAARGDGTMPPPPEDTYVYGDAASPPGTVRITEDQSGASALVSPVAAAARPPGGVGSGRGGPTDPPVSRWGDASERAGCARRLRAAAAIGGMLRGAVRDRTGFASCVGASVSPMLAKVASDLQKPDSLNVLYPRRSPNICDNMPLRRIPGLGSQTLRVLSSCLEEHCGKLSGERKWWTCRDLLNVPFSAMVGALADSNVSRPSSEQTCDLLRKRCQGIDPIPVADDKGSLSKTVSVEDSFRRGTVRTREAVEAILEELFVRLSRLLDERKSYSESPDCAHPTTLRLSVRMVDVRSCDARRPFISTSKHCHFDGKTLLLLDDNFQKINLLRTAVLPLTKALIFGKDKTWINFTKLNIAATNFIDAADDSASQTREKKGCGQQSVAKFFPPTSSVVGKKRPVEAPNVNLGRQEKKIKTMEMFTPVRPPPSQLRNSSTPKEMMPGNTSSLSKVATKAPSTITSSIL